MANRGLDGCGAWFRLLATVLLAALLCTCGGGSAPPDDPIDPEENDDVARAAQLTKQAVVDLTGGSDDFASACARLQNARTLDPKNEAARLFGAVACWLEFLKETSGPTGTFRDLYSRSGFRNPNAAESFWDFGLERVEHYEGTFKNSSPSAGELLTYLQNEYIPELRDLADALGAVSQGFEYEIDAGVGGRFFDELEPSDRRVYVLDYGEVMVAHAAALVHLGWMDLFLAYDWDDLQPNDLDEEDVPNLNAAEVVYTDYPNLGKLVSTTFLNAAQTELESAWSAYQNASQHIRGEGTAASERGILTLGRDVFSSTQERDEFLDDESRCRTWFDDLVRYFDLDSTHVIGSMPDGTPLSADERIGVNLYQLFRGQDLRDLFVKTIINPIDGERVFGVSGWSEFSTHMATLGGVLASYGGRAPAAGDLAALGYRVRVDSPPVASKIIDGAFSDWNAGVNCVQVAGPPEVAAIAPDPGGLFEDAADVPNVGRVYVSVSGSDLYVNLDRDLTQILSGYYDGYTIHIQGPEGYGTVWYSAPNPWNSGGGHNAAGGPSASLTPEYAWTYGQGIEMRFPMGSGGSGSWAEIEISVYANNYGGSYRSVRDKIYVKVR